MAASSESATDVKHGHRDGLMPRVRWSQLTDAPLSGLALAREAGLILAWDDAHNLYLIDLAGHRVRTKRTPVPLLAATISDDASQIIAASKEGDIWWLGDSLEPRLHQGTYRHLIGIALSPQGEYFAAGLNDNHTHIYDCLGRRVTNLLTHRPLRYLAFLSGQALMLGVAEYGLAGCYELDGEPRWQDALWSSAGHISASGDGYVILISCFGHGLLRYGLDGTNEGAYHLGGGVARASTDYDGKLFAAATLEGEILIVNAAGHVLWRQMLPRPAREIALDPAGEFIIYGVETGEISLVDLVPSDGTAPTELKPIGGLSTAFPASGPMVQPHTAPSTGREDAAVSLRHLREPTWKVAAFDSESQAETAVLQLVEQPVLVAVFSNRRHVEVYDERGQRIHASDKMSGVGRYLDADAAMVVAATDREVLVYDVASNASLRFDQRCVQISHIRVDSEAAEIVLVEERDRLSRFDLAGNRRWVVTLDAAVEGLAVGAHRTCAVTTEDGRLIVFDGDRRIIGEFRTMPREALAIVRLGPHWITLAGKSQQVRSHRLDGSIEWQTTIPTEAWRLVRLASRVVARSATGRLFVVDARGRIVLDSTELPPEAILFLNRADEASALFWRAGNLMVTDLVGRVAWRHLSSETLGPVATGAAGAACALGRELAFFAE